MGLPFNASGAAPSTRLAILPTVIVAHATPVTGTY